MEEQVIKDAIEFDKRCEELFNYDTVQKAQRKVLRDLAQQIIDIYQKGFIDCPNCGCHISSDDISLIQVCKDRETLEKIYRRGFYDGQQKKKDETYLDDHNDCCRDFSNP